MIKEFPEIKDVDIAFGGYPNGWFHETLKEAQEKGFGINNCTRAAQLFYNGGKLNLNKKLDNEYLNSGMRTLKAVLGSFEPSHQDKMAVCEYIIHCLENEK